MYVCINVCVYDNITSIIWHRKPNISISHIDIGDKLCLKYASCFFLWPLLYICTLYNDVCNVFPHYE